MREEQVVPGEASAPGGGPGDDGPPAPIRRTVTGEIEGLYRFAVARLGPLAHLAEDAVQQAVLIAMAHASPPEDERSQCAWLRGIVQNVIRREMRSMRRGRDAIRRASTARQGATPGAAPHAADDRTRLVRALYLAVTELDRADQDLFYSFYGSGRSQASIAAELGTTAKGVETRLYRMRARLKSALERMTDGFS
jgi:RNA polymerase sigma factor (sigma-70 family)